MVDRGDHIQGAAAAGVVEYLQGHDRGAGGDADNASAIDQGADGARHVGAVAGTISEGILAGDPAA